MSAPRAPGCQGQNTALRPAVRPHGRCTAPGRSGTIRPVSINRRDREGAGDDTHSSRLGWRRLRCGRAVPGDWRPGGEHAEAAPRPSHLALRTTERAACVPEFELVQPDLFGVSGGQPNCWADFNNDGLLDLFVGMNGKSPTSSTQSRRRDVHRRRRPSRSCRRDRHPRRGVRRFRR